MNNKQKQLQKVASILGLNAIIPYTVTLQSGVSIEAEALIEDLMKPKGTLFFTSATVEGDACWEHKAEFVSYGFTIYGGDLITDEIMDQDLDDYIEMFTEWGWGNPDKPKPQWMIDWETAHPEELDDTE